MYVTNTDYFGTVMVPLEYFNTLEDEADQFTYVRLEAMGKAELSSPDS